MTIDVLQTKHYFAVCVFQSIFVSKHYLITQSNTITTETIQVTNSIH